MTCAPYDLKINKSFKKTRIVLQEEFCTGEEK